jgi:ArsR family transcriptional regulator
MVTNLVEFFKAVSDITRLRIVNLLLHYSTINVNDLTQILNLPQSNISRHLAILRKSGWLLFNRRDKWVYYKINPDLNRQLLMVFKEMFKNYLQLETDLKNAESRLL